MNSPVTGISDKAQVEIFKPVASRCIKTTCPYCGTGCGVEAKISKQDETGLSAKSDLGSIDAIEINGDSTHPANRGKLCSKGTNLIETLDPDARLLHPELNGQRVSWDQALDAAAGQIRTIIDQHGADAFAIYCSGQLLTEDYYVANKLMKGFIGTANIDTNSRLCMASAVAGHKRAFGSDSVPGCYDDLDQAELMVLTGSNMAWCHPILFNRIKTAKAANPDHKLVVIDPRRTDSCDPADLHLPLKPGTDATLFNGLLVYLADQNALDQDFIDSHTDNFGATLEQARSSAADIAAVARICELEISAVETFYRWFANTPKTVTAFSQGINQSSSGTDKVNAIINTHLATGRIGHPGMSPFSITGQPNAMGGREVGGLANQLAAHMELDNPNHRDLVGRFWNTDTLAEQPGHKAVDLFQAIETGQVKAVWIIATNPVDSLPDADRVRAALQQCPLVMVSDCMAHTDTAELAHIRLPATGWGERDGTVTNAERCISRQRAILPASGEAKPDWWMLSQLGQRLGFAESFDYQAPWQIFREHAQLSAFENNTDGSIRSFNLAGLSDLDADGYAALQPVRWPVAGAPNLLDDNHSPIESQQPVGTDRLFGDGAFFTASGKANFIAIEPRLPHKSPDTQYPLVLNTGRIRDQWHTMTRTGLSPRLSSHRPEPFVEIHPAEAQRQQLQDGNIARLSSHWGTMLARVRITDSIRPGQLFVPMHWTAQFASLGRMGTLVNPVVDPLSGQPESKQTPVRIEPYEAQWYGFLLRRSGSDSQLLTDSFKPEFDPNNNLYQVRVTGTDHQRYELASTAAISDWHQQARSWIDNSQQDQDEWFEYSNLSQGDYRTALIHDGQLQAVLIISAMPQLPERDWLGSLFSRQQLSDAERLSLLSACPPPGTTYSGPVVCACFGVGRHSIEQAIADQQLDSVDAIGAALQAGTNCGSCVPEIKQLLAESV